MSQQHFPAGPIPDDRDAALVAEQGRIGRIVEMANRQQSHRQALYDQLRGAAAQLHQMAQAHQAQTASAQHLEDIHIVREIVESLRAVGYDVVITIAEAVVTYAATDAAIGERFAINAEKGKGGAAAVELATKLGLGPASPDDSPPAPGTSPEPA